MYICGDARRETSFPRKRPYVPLYPVIRRDSMVSSDVHQFSIITELLGTPPEDVIGTICSENVSSTAIMFK